MEDLTGQKVCWNCEFATIDTKFENLDLEGNPTLVRCPRERYARIRSEEACRHFKMKKQ